MRSRIAFVLVLVVSSLAAQGTISSLSPSSIAAGGATFTLTVNGSGFASANIVQWDGVNRSTTFVSATELTASIPASLIAAGGAHAVRVRLSVLSTVFSNTVTFNVINPNPTLVSLSPSVAAAGGPSLTITVGGTNYNATSVVRFDGTPLATTLVSSTQMTAIVPAASITAVVNHTITVNNPAPGGGTTGGLTLAIVNPVPTFSIVSPSAISTGVATTLAVTGSGFNASTQIRVGGVAQATAFVSTTSVTASVTALVTGLLAIDVINPAPGGGISIASGTVSVQNPLPTLASISPATVTAGSPTLTLTASGSGFAPASVVRLDEVPIATTFVSVSQLTATVPSTSMSAAGNHTVKVFTPSPGGGVSSGQAFVVANPVPVITSFSPSSAVEGSGPITISVVGSGFVPTSVVQVTIVQVGTVGVTTTFLGPVALSAVIPTSMTAIAGTLALAVANPAPGGGTTAFGTFQVTNPVPTLSSLNPNGSVAGALPFTLTATGTNYNASTAILLDGSPLATTLVSPTQVSTTIPSSLTTVGGAHTISVSNAAPGGGTSGGAGWIVANPPPTFVSSTPATALVGVTTTISVQGVNFNPSTVVRVNGTPLPTTISSSTQILGTITPSTSTLGMTFTIDVFSPPPVGGAAGLGSLSIENPLPVLSTLSPNALPAGSPATALTVSGSDFVTGSSVRFNGAALTTVVVSGTQLLATIPAVLLASGATNLITVLNPGPGGGTSAPAQLTVSNPSPAISGITPVSTLAGSPGFSMSVTGSGYVPTSTVLLDGAPLVTTFTNSAILAAFVPTSALAAGGVHAIVVTNAPPGGGSSSSVTYTVTNPIPVLAALLTPTASAGGPDLGLAVSGTSFVATSVVTIDGSPLATTFGSSSQLSANVPAALTASGGIHAIAVTSPGPGGGTTASLPFTVVNPAPVITSLSLVLIAGGGPDLPLSVFGLGFVPATVFTASGVSIGATYQSPSLMTIMLPQVLQRAIREIAITATNAAPGGGISSTQLVIDGPVLASTVPAFLPVMTVAASAVTFAVNGGTYTGSDVIHVNGLPRPTTLVNAGVLSCTVDGTVPAMLQPGGFAVTVVRSGLAGLLASNAVAMTVGIAGTPDNAGTVTLCPAAPAPGQGFDVRVETAVANLPFTLVADVAPPPTFILGVAPGFDLAVGPGLGSAIVLVDGIGLFGPGSGASLASDSLAYFGLAGPRGLFEILGIAPPPGGFGMTVSLAAFYIDPASPIGLNATPPSGPYTL